MADRHVLYKNGVKEIAQSFGLSITFMAKWNEDAAGSSCHIHNSLTGEAGDSRFVDGSGPHQLSKTLQHYLAGQLALARSAMYFFAPFVNSYKRFQSRSFAPTALVWSFDNRTAGFRLLRGEHNVRIECRLPGADVNPYLAYAALIAAGLHGIDAQLELPPPFIGNAYDIQQTGFSLQAALRDLDDCGPLRDAFGDEVIDHYVRTGRWEAQVFDRAVTSWELVRYFERA
jgi:glutamine synthetase